MSKYYVLKPVIKSSDRQEKERLLALGLKKCADCQKTKEIGLFHKLKVNWDGYHTYCKSCRREKMISCKDQIIKYKNQYRKENPHIELWRSILRSCLRRMGKKKSATTLNLLGYSAEELRTHIEFLWSPGMSWDNHGDWHIDHIRPVRSFPAETEPRIVNGLPNLRPMWATTREMYGVTYEGNLNKQGKWDEKESKISQGDGF